jgi:hypothetical protein
MPRSFTTYHLRMRAAIFESNVVTVTGFACEKDRASRIDTFADHVDRVLWSVGVVGLPCMWMPKEYVGPRSVDEADMNEDSGHVLSPPRVGGYARVVEETRQ